MSKELNCFVIGLMNIKDVDNSIFDAKEAFVKANFKIKVIIGA